MARSIDRILITGAAGRLGSFMRRQLKGQVRLLRLSDIAPMKPPEPGEEVVQCDLSDRLGVEGMCQDIDAIIHFGGCPRETEWPDIVQPNIVGAINLWEGARRGDVDRVLVASSNHAIGLYRRSQRLDHWAPQRPDSRYGLSKAFGEDIASLYAYKHGIRGFCMRIGTCLPEPMNARALATWLSYADLDRLVKVGLTAAYTYEIVYGVSRNTRSWWDNSNAYRLGYDPQDNAEDFAARVSGIAATDPLAEEFQGGTFVSPDFTADPAAIP
jgi:uronate dehydrogenase